MANNELGDIGSVFDDATVQLIGGLSPSNTTAVLDDLTYVQSGLTDFLAAHSEFAHDATGLHLQEVIDQINIEIAYIHNQATTGDWTPKGINDVQRDILDIVNGDELLNGLSGFTPLPSLLHDPRPFQLSVTQTAFIEKWAADSSALGALAIAAASDPGHNGDRALIQKLQDFANLADTFSEAQGGLFSARFDNELVQDGNTGSLVRGLIAAVQKNDLALATAAAHELASNADDVLGNTTSVGEATPSAPTEVGPSGDFATLGSIFDDATVQLVGGISPANKTAVLSDLALVQTGLETYLAGHSDLQHNATGLHIQEVIGQLSLETSYINGQATAGAWIPKGINDIHRDILDIMNGDDVLSELGGFSALPALSNAPKPFALDATQTAFMFDWATHSATLGTMAVAAASDPGHSKDKELISLLQDFAQSAEDFSEAQGGLFSARFDNELVQNGNTGTLVRGLITAVHNNDPELAAAAATALVNNAADVMGNTIPLETAIADFGPSR